MSLRAAGITELANWKMGQPDFLTWVKYMGIEERNAARMVTQLLRTSVFDISQYMDQSPQETIHEIMQNDHLIYGICDNYHVIQLEAIKWIKKYIDTPKPVINNVLDYYGKTGEFAFRVARSTKCRVTYVDQNPYFDFAKFRFRAKGVHYTIKSVPADPIHPRPDLGDERYGFIMSPDLPLEVTPDWLAWLETHIYPYGLMATRAKMPWKAVAKVANDCYIYQFVPKTQAESSESAK
jgi:hypothetical protein